MNTPVKVYTKGEFIEYRKAQESSHIDKTDVDNVLSSLVTVEINPTELCNRRCEFCPRVDSNVFPNRNLHMTDKTAFAIAGQLSDIGYKGRISITGWGEPLLTKRLDDIVWIFRELLPRNVIEMNTNGDKLTSEKIKSLFANGLTYLYINMYDGPEQLGQFTEMFKQAGISGERFRLRCRWQGPEDSYGIVMNNRGGALNLPDLGHSPLTEPLKQVCHYPAYKAFIDYDGTVYGCSNDWRRTTPVENVNHRHFRDIWLSERMKQIRLKVFNADRSETMCRQCDVNGTLTGKRSMDILNNYYQNERLENKA